MTKDKNNFSRGDIFHIFFPKSDMTPTHTPPKPDIQLHGRHMVICLTDSSDQNVPLNLVGIVPISTAKSAVLKNKLTLTHLRLPKSDFPFLDHDSYALIFQSRPVGRHWLEDRNFVGNILDYDPDIMKKIGILSLFYTGAYKDVMDFAEQKYKESIFSEEQTAD